MAGSAPLTMAGSAPLTMAGIMQESSVVTTDSPMPRDTFTEMVSLQTFNGSWKLDKSLADHVGIELDKLEKSIPKEWSVNLRVSVPPDIWATALAIAFFEVAFADRQVDWHLIISKALDWLEEEVEKFGASRQGSVKLNITLIQAAKEFLENNGVKPAEDELKGL